jgi:hypothetical protein
MKRFAELLDRLAYEPARNNKLRLITEHLRSTPDPIAAGRWRRSPARSASSTPSPASSAP